MRGTLILMMLAGTPAQAHDWYTGKQDPYTHSDCCGEKDCRPIETAEVRRLPNGDYVYLPYRWTIPRYRVQRSADDRYHICVKVKHLELKGRPEMWRNWLCFFAPLHTS
jgi:hypothetical protein